MVDIQPIKKKLFYIYEKNQQHLFSLWYRGYPDFILKSRCRTVRDEIPVFCFHSVQPARFEEQMDYLTANGYRTITCDQLYEYIMGDRPIPERTIMLTFDDGLSTLWSVAYPLLKKYSLTAVCFIVPGIVEDDVPKKGSSESLCTWREIKEMHEDGVIDFQSHTLYHHRVFTSSKLIDFYNPKFDVGFYNTNIPLYLKNDKDEVERKMEFGTPIYAYMPRMAGKNRFFDDEGLRRASIEFVRNRGEGLFFKRQNWHRELMSFVKNYRKENNIPLNYESNKEKSESIYQDLLQSRRLIEDKLTDKQVRHLCYPWFMGSVLAVELSKKAGYLTNFWGTLKNKNTNRPQDDPFKIVRLKDDYIFRLPGKGRRSFKRIIKEIFGLNVRNIYQRFFLTCTTVRKSPERIMNYSF